MRRMCDELACLDERFPGGKAIVMVTYLAAQYLIATGWARRVDPDVVVPI